MIYFEIAKSLARSQRDMLLDLIKSNYKNPDDQNVKTFLAEIQADTYSDEEIERIYNYELKRLEEKTKTDSVRKG